MEEKPKIFCIGNAAFHKKVRHEFIGKDAFKNDLEKGDVKLSFAQKVGQTTKRTPEYVVLGGSDLEKVEELSQIRDLFPDSEIILAGGVTWEKFEQLSRKEYHFVSHHSSIEKFARYICGKIKL